MKQLLKRIKQISMLLLVISLIGCENEDTILPEVISSFTHTINADTGTVTFINTSVNSKNYFWNFEDKNGNITSSTEIDPVKTFTTGEYKVTLKATNVAGASDTSEDIIVISDAGAPVITLLGETTINMTVGDDPFTDPGATAEDDVDGDLTANIVVGGDTVDESTAGTYVITYNVSDAADNAATERTRTVIVAEVVLTCPETLLALPIDFDCDGTDYESKDTGDVAFEVIDNPELSGINATPSKVAKLVFDANQPWENMNLNLDTPISFATDKSVKLKLFSSTARAVKLKFETGGVAVENDQNHTGSGWEELTFTLASAESYSNLILFVDGGSDTTGTFYVDDIEQVAAVPGPSPSNLILDFENNLSGIGVDAFESAGELLANPVSGGINTSPNVYAISYGVGNQWWGGVGFVVGAAALSDADAEYKVKLYSTVAPINVLFEVEQNGVGGTVGNTQEITTANEWVEVTFTLQGGAGIDRVLVRPAVGDKSGTKTHDGILYVDDIVSIEGEGTPPDACPAPPAGELLPNGDFEAIGDCWELIQNGGTVTVSSTISNGGTKSGEISTAPLQNPALKQTRFAVGLIQPNTSYTVSFDIKASIALVDGAVLKAFAFSEGADGGGVGATQHILEGGLGSVSASWETKTYTFTTPAGADQVAGGLSFLVEVVCGGANTCAGTVNVDNVVVKVTP
jgi:hypothetical protein